MDLSTYPVEKHNAEVRELWKLFWQGKAPRVPVVFGLNPRVLLLDPNRNPFPDIDFEAYFASPEVMLRVELAFDDWVRHNVLQDQELGLPAEGWHVWVDFQNVYEAAWLGCPIIYRKDQVPDTQPILHTPEDVKRFLSRGLPSPTQNLMGKALEFYDFFLTRKNEGFTYKGRPLGQIDPAALGSDGPFTLACSLLGPENACVFLKLYPDLMREFLTYLGEAIVTRIKALRRLVGWQPGPAIGLADDSIQLISTDDYVEFVMPTHRHFYDELGEPGQRRSMHLCGDATRHFPLIQQELGVTEFDTGFPVDFAWLREVLGEEVFIWGGPNVSLLLRGTPEAVREETRRILLSGVTRGRRFVLREGNNVSPGTPLENMEAMYWAGREYGSFEGDLSN